MTTMLHVRGVTFDLDDTLWCGNKVIQKANASFHGYLQTHQPALTQAFPPAEFDSVMRRFIREQPEKAHDYTYLRKQVLKHCIGQVGGHTLNLQEEKDLEQFVEDAFQAFLIPRSQPEFFDGVEKMLVQLDQHLRSQAIAWKKLSPNESPTEQELSVVGVITNGNCVQACLPDFFQDHISFMVSAEAVGKAKPALDIFEAAMAYYPAHYDKAHIVHVGDHYAYDVEGAKHAGLRTIWVNANWDKPNALRRQDLSAEDAEKYEAADAIVKTVDAVLDVITLWNKMAENETATS